MESRKRTYDSNADIDKIESGKRIRPEDIINPIDPNKPSSSSSFTRLLLTRAEFSCIIGRGGLNVTKIRSTCGAFIQGCDIDDQNRLMVITGTPRQVIDAFDSISECIEEVQSGGLHDGGDILLKILLDTSCVGRVIGVAGATIVNIRQTAGASLTQVSKEPREIGGVVLRTLTVEGSLRALRSVHYLIHELFADPTMLATRSSKVSHLPEYSRTSSNKVSNREALFNDIAASPQGFTNGQTLPFGTLVTYGVLPETVRQLSDMRAYLSQQFGLELMVCPEMPSIGPISVPLGSKNEALSSSSLPTSDSEITLLVPNTSVGAIMGVGGQLLRVLEAEYSAHVSVNRAEERSTPGLRKVTIERGSKYAVSDQDAVENMKLCADRIRLLVEEHRSRVAEGR